MENSVKKLKTIAISEVWYPEDSTSPSDKPYFFVSVEDHVNGDSAEERFNTLEEAEEYASEVSKRPLKPFDINAFPHVRR